MKNYADNKTPNKNQFVAAETSETAERDGAAFQFMDNRKVQRTSIGKQERGVVDNRNNSMQFKQTIDSGVSSPVFNNSQPAQLKTDIKHTSTNMTWKNKSGVVGVKVEATLDPQEKVLGSAVGGQEGYTDIDKQVSKYNGGAWARGHLLNHDLGGSGVPENLFPITSGANKRHANYVEYRVKDALSAANQAHIKDNDVKDTVYYKVEAKGTPSNAQFVCEWEYQDKDGNQKDVGVEGVDSEGKWVIPSKLKGPNDGGSAPVVDPYHNSKNAGAKKAIIWHHGNRKGIKSDSDKVTWEQQENDPGNILSQFDMNLGGYGYADGNMTTEERIEAQKEAIARKMETLEKHCYDKLQISIGEAASDEAYKTYYKNSGISRLKRDVKGAYTQKFNDAIKDLKDFIDSFIRNPKLLDDIMEDEEDAPDLRPIMVQMIRETDAYLDKEKKCTEQLLEDENLVRKDIIKDILENEFYQEDIHGMHASIPGWIKVKSSAIEGYEVGEKIRTNKGVLEITDILTRYFGESTVSFE